MTSRVIFFFPGSCMFVGCINQACVTRCSSDANCNNFCEWPSYCGGQAIISCSCGSYCVTSCTADCYSGNGCYSDCRRNCETSCGDSSCKMSGCSV